MSVLDREDAEKKASLAWEKYRAEMISLGADPTALEHDKQCALLFFFNGFVEGIKSTTAYIRNN